MLKLRVVTALAIATIFLLSLFLLPANGFMLFMAIVLLVGAWEWANLSGFEQRYQRIVYCCSTVVLMLLVAFYTGIGFQNTISMEAVRTILLVACVWWAVALLWVQSYPSSTVLWGGRWPRLLMGWLVLVPAWLSLTYLHQSSYGSWMILLVMSAVFVSDTGAYFFGRAFGRRKLAKEVSPGKSWEGFWGGLLCCIALSLAVSLYAEFGSWQSLLIVLLFTGLASVLGDLLESMVKRHRCIKDSGSLLPGHGGVMDRLDSITASAPVFALGAILSGWMV